MDVLVEIFQHSRTGYHGSSDQIISIFSKWLLWLLYLYHVNIPELVTMVTLRHFNI